MKTHNKIKLVLGMLVIFMLTTASAFASPSYQQPDTKRIEGSPIDIEVGSNGSIQVYHEETGTRGAAYGTADSGFFLAIRGADGNYASSDIYGSELHTHGTSGGSSAFANGGGTVTGLSLVSHTGPTGAGTIVDPFKVVTNQTLNGSGANLGVVQTVSYINGNDYFRQDWAITNNGNSETCFKAYHAADIFFAGSDTGAGYYNAATGSVGGKGTKTDGSDWFMVFTPVTPATHYQEGLYHSPGIWSAVHTAADLNDSIDPNVVDNGIALQWNKCVQPGETLTITDLWSFGENEESVIPPTPIPPTATPPPIPTPKIVTCSWGDVHIRTIDGLTYDFQQVGDFVLAQTPSREVVVQARQEWHPNNPRVSLNTAAAMNVGGDKLEFYVQPTRSFYINDVLTPLPTSDHQLPNGGSIRPANGNDFTIVWPDNNTAARVNMHQNNTYMNIGVKKLSGTNTYEGICGNYDGNAQNDMQVRNGAVINRPFNSTQLKTFGDSWLVPAGESLLDAPVSLDSQRVLISLPSQSNEDQLTLDDLDPAARESARQTCAAAGITDPVILDGCTYDVAATNDESFVDGAADMNDTLAELPAEEQVHVLAAEPEGVTPTDPPAPAGGNDGEDEGGPLAGVCGAPLAMPLMGLVFMVGTRRRKQL